MFGEFAVSFGNFVSVLSAFFVENFLDLSVGQLFLSDFQNGRRPNARFFVIDLCIAIEGVGFPIFIEADFGNKHPQRMRDGLVVRIEQKLKHIFERFCSEFPVR